jgi:hypothetical protein
MQQSRLRVALGRAAAAGGAVALCGAAAARTPDVFHPVVVEVFQSQGCSSCPPTNANVNAIAVRPEVLALSFAVTYWDQLGWKDTFAKPAYTARQWAYAHGLHRDNVATPQVVLDGRSDLVGNDRAALEAAIRTAGSPDGPALVITPSAVSIAAGPTPAKGADVWLVRYDPRVQLVAIRRGENTGKTLPHRNVVRELIRLGGWNGKAVSYRLPQASDAELKTAILVQATGGGHILGAGYG